MQVRLGRHPGRAPVAVDGLLARPHEHAGPHERDARHGEGHGERLAVHVPVALEAAAQHDAEKDSSLAGGAGDGEDAQARHLVAVADAREHQQHEEREHT